MRSRAAKRPGSCCASRPGAAQRGSTLTLGAIQMIRTDGFYRSDPIDWEDWHGGVHMHGSSVQFWRFLTDFQWIRCISENHALPFWHLSEHQRNAPSGPVLLERFIRGSYELSPQSITVIEPSPSPIGPKMLRHTWLVSKNKLVPTQQGHYIGGVPLSFVQGVA